MLARDAVAVFADATVFGESVQYRPNSDTPGIPFNVQVNRSQQIMPIQGVSVGGFVAPKDTVWIPYDAAGVNGLSAKPDTGGSQLFLPRSIGAAGEWRHITRIVTEDPGGWTVELR